MLWGIEVRWTQCQAQPLDQFSVWVPLVTRLKRLTLLPRVRAGRSCPDRTKKTDAVLGRPYS